MEHDDTYRAALARAAQILGGAVALSRHLQVPMKDLTHWLAGDGVPSTGVFLRVIDVIIEDGSKPRFLPRAANDEIDAKAKRGA
jgi:hypothetical protein